MRVWIGAIEEWTKLRLANKGSPEIEAVGGDLDFDALVVEGGVGGETIEVPSDTEGCLMTWGHRKGLT